MRMTALEKVLVNRPTKGAANVARIRTRLAGLGLTGPLETLEIGPGAGDVAAALAGELAHRVIGTDVDPAQVALARARHTGVPRVQYSVADATALEFPAAQFDPVIAQNVFQHVPAWRAIVAEISRVLRPGGHLLWLELTPPRAIKWSLTPLRRLFRLYAMTDVLAALGDHGLTPIMVRPLMRWPALRHELVARKQVVSRRTLPSARECAHD